MLVEPVVQALKTVAPRESADGSPPELPVYLARPQGGASGRRPGLVVIQEIFGVNAHIQDVARRFARMGYAVVSPDLFYRNGAWQEYAYSDVPSARVQMAALTEEGVVGDLRAALDFLAAQPDVDPARLGVVGYCLGGRLSWVAASRLPERVKAAAIYYGGGIILEQTTPNWPVSPLERAGQIRCPVIGFFGGLDQHLPRAYVERVDGALAAAGVNRQIFYYPEADHGFFCDARATYNARAAQDAWHRTLRFFAAHLGPVPAVDWQV